MRLSILFRLPNQPTLSIEFVVDTGFEGALTLPPAAVTALNLTYVVDIVVNLADGSQRKVGAYQATITWDGQDTDVAVFAMGDRPLLGTSLLDGFNLSVDFADGGAITIQRLP